MLIRPSSTDVRFQGQINGIGEKSSESGEKFSQCGLRRDFGDWAGQVDGDWIGLEVDWEC